MKYYLILGIMLIAVLQCFAVNTHFTPIWTGNGVDHMNLYVTSASINGIPLNIGDEVAVFDGNKCVGVTRLTSYYNSTISIVISKNDAGEGNTPNGYTPGNPIRFAIWHSGSNREIFQGRNLSVVFDSGPNLFTPNETASVHLFTPDNQHFVTVWDGNGTDQMNFYVNSAQIIGVPLEAGDEIAVFDGQYCVGSEKIYQSYNSIIPIVVSKLDRVYESDPVNGYTPGNTAFFKVWRANSQAEYIQNAESLDHRLIVNYIQGDSIFSIGSTSAVTITSPVMSHFTKSWTGNGVDQMNFYVNSAMIYGAPLGMGDEIAIFDGTQCVGYTKIFGYEQPRSVIPIIVSKNEYTNPASLNGYTVGNTASFKIWDASTNTEIVEGDGLSVNYETGTAIFNIGASTLLSLNALIKLNSPIFNYESGTYTEGINLSITTDMAGAVVRATNDGTEPNDETPIHNPPVFLQGDHDWVIKAKVYKDNYQSSDIIIKNYHITGTLEAPILTPDHTIPNHDPVNISMTCSNPNATIHYTLDGSEPTITSTTYQGTFLISQTKTIKAKAFLTDWISSTITEAQYIVLNTPTNLTASAIGATVNLVWNAVLINPASELRTLNGYRIYRRIGNTGDFTIVNTNLVTTTTYSDNDLTPNTYYYYVVAVYSEGISNQSNTAEVQVLKVADPTFNPVAGTYTSAQNVTISTTTANAQIRYTINGTEPTASSTLYTAPINIPLNTNRTIKAKAFKINYIASNIVTAVYNITGTVLSPVFNPNPGLYEDSVRVTITCATPSAQIRYTLNGTEPSASSPLYTNSLLITTTTTLKAKAFKTDWQASATTTGAYQIHVVEDNPELQTKTNLFMPYPNPFNPSTNIRFSLKSNSYLDLEIYNIKGQKVRTLISGNMPAGESNIVWNGVNDDNHVVPGGIYLVRMKADNFTQLRKIILIK